MAKEPKTKKRSASKSTAASDLPLKIEHGPRKKRKQGKPPVRLVSHKERSRWFRGRTAWPMREAPTHYMIGMREMIKKTLAPAPGNSQWELAGPSNTGGRMTSVVCHPTQPEKIWAGAAGGGVWHSTDSGQTWQPLWHDQDVLNVGSLAIDPKNPQVLYCGTGEANLSADSYAGVGIYRSLDGGQTWHLHASSLQTDVPPRIGVIAIDPFNSKHILIGGVGFAELSSEDNAFGGMYTSIDGGVSWKRETFVASQNYWCHSIVFDPKTKNTIYATFTARGMRNGIYRSADGGKNWKQLTNGLPSPERMGRTSLAVSLSNPKVLYAIATGTTSVDSDTVIGVFRTSNRGDKWTNVAGNHFNEERQMSYGSTIEVHPKKSNHVICGGVDLHLSTDGGKNWKQVTRWDANRGNSDYAHADHHCLLMPAARPGRVYDMNDGGMDISEDGGLTWVNRSSGLAATMFYDLEVAQSDARFYGGGSQDNGTVVTTNGDASDFFEILGGDGGWMVIDPNNAAHLFASYYNFHIYRFKNGQWKNVSPGGNNADKSIWMCFITMDPNDSNTLFTGTYRVWRTKTDGNAWTPVSLSLDDSYITAIEIAPNDSKRIYVGTENGGIFRSTDGGNTWSANLASTDLPGHSITRLEANPTNANIVYATLANTGHSHVFRSNNGGLTWQDVDRGQLPDVAHHSIVIPRDKPNSVYVCNDAGVYVSLDGGQTWMNLTRNLPHTMVVDLVHHASSNTLYAATYGRSIWRVKL